MTRLGVLRGGREIAVTVTLGTFPDEAAGPMNAPASQPAGRHGMTLRDLTPDLAERLEMPRGSKGVVVMDVETGTPADEAGLRRGDVILTVNGNEVGSTATFDTEISRARPDGLARLRFLRGANHQIVVIRLD